MKNQPFISFLKLFREDAVFDSAGRLFHILAPRKEKHFCPLADLFFGNLKSVSVFRRLREEHAEFFVKRLHRYCGAKSLSDLKNILCHSATKSFPRVFSFSLVFRLLHIGCWVILCHIIIDDRRPSDVPLI